MPGNLFIDAGIPFQGKILIKLLISFIAPNKLGRRSIKGQASNFKDKVPGKQESIDQSFQIIHSVCHIIIFG
jgi:hypothetical protein